MIEERSAIDAYRFLLTNRLFTYVRGPLRKAKPVKRHIMVIVKRSTNLPGDATIIIRKTNVKKPKSAAVAKEMIA